MNASLSSVYGVPEYLHYDEEHPNYPKSPHAVTKRSTEHYCNVYDDLHNLPTVNLRYFTVCGPRMRPDMAISNFVSRCLNDEPPIIYGDGEQTRDFTYTANIVNVDHSLLTHNSADDETMNIGSTDNIEYAEARDGDTEHTHADISKATELIGYEPSRDIREGVGEFIEWYEDNRE